jgi:hypothetical protein
LNENSARSKVRFRAKADIRVRLVLILDADQISQTCAALDFSKAAKMTGAAPEPAAPAN